MAEIVYILCAVTSAVCALLLVRGYLRSRARLLLWSSLCFCGLLINNLLLLLDKIALPDVDLSFWRTSSALLSISLLLYGLIWDAET
jgi:hypothetical protein